MTTKSKIVLVGLALAQALFLAAPTPADTPLVHLDTPTALERGSLAGRVDVRPFGGHEDILYTSVAARLGLGRRAEGIVRGSFAERKSAPIAGGRAIRHGGNDLELAIKAQLDSEARSAGLVGVSFADTPAQNSAHLTLGATAEFGSASFRYVLNPRAVLIDGNTLVGIGIGGRVRLRDDIHLVADYTPIVAGDNTRDVTSGARKRRDVFGAAVRFHTGRSGDLTIDIGYTNGTGATTGFGLTPALGGGGAVYFALAARR